MGKSKDIIKEPKSGEIAKLKKHIRHLENEITKLKSELRTYDKVFNKNITFLKEKTNNLSLEDLIKGANDELNLQQIKQVKNHTFEDLKRKWMCHKCNIGVMKMVIVPFGEGSAYFRKCNHNGCTNRTETKTYTEEVDKGI